MRTSPAAGKSSAQPPPVLREIANKAAEVGREGAARFNDRFQGVLKASFGREARTWRRRKNVPHLHRAAAERRLTKRHRLANRGERLRNGFKHGVIDGPVRSFAFENQIEGLARGRASLENRAPKAAHGVQYVEKRGRMGSEPGIERLEGRLTHHRVVVVLEHRDRRAEAERSRSAVFPHRFDRHRAREVSVYGGDRADDARGNFAREGPEFFVFPERDVFSAGPRPETQRVVLGCVPLLRSALFERVKQRFGRFFQSKRQGIGLRARGDGRRVRGVEPEMQTADRLERSDEVNAASVDVKRLRER